MTTTKEITRLEKSSVNLSVTVGKEDLRAEYDDLLSNYTKSVQLPGFRKGKVPREVLERKFAEALKDETLGKVIEKALGEIFEDESLPRENRPLPYCRPELKDEPKLDFDTDLVFSVVYDVLPSVKVGKSEGLEVEIPNVSISEEDISRELEVIRDRNSIVLDKNDGESAAKGDVVTIDYWEMDDSGAVLSGGERKDFSFTLGSGQNAYKFDDEIAGMKKGETKEFSKTYAADDESFPGQIKKLKVSLTALKVKKLPDLNDDLAQDVDEKFKTLEDLKNSIRKRLEKDLERRLLNLKTDKLLEKLMENTPVEIPESMVRLELDSRWRNMAMRFNTDAEGLFNMMGPQAEKIIESWRGEAEKSLHSRLIVETMIEELKLEVSAEDLEKDLERMAEETGSDLEEVKKYYGEDRMRNLLTEDLKERKLFDILFEKNTLKTGKKTNYIDLAEKNG
ncbi:MAG: trigger factor [Treponema sp.]|nr:trigger factor [Treponema sp.]